MEYKFKEPKNTAVFTMKQIINDQQPILFVGHDKDDKVWQFLSGGPIKKGDVMLAALKEITDLDPTINELYDMPLGWQASRKSIKDPWFRIEVK